MDKNTSINMGNESSAHNNINKSIINEKAHNSYNNEMNNLQILCPNCHAMQTNSGMDDKYASAKKKEKSEEEIKEKIEEKDIEKRSKMCKECNKIKSRISERPTREELKNLIRKLPFTTIGKQYNVTDNSIRKWCDFYNLPRTKDTINKLSDEEWEKI